MLTQRSTVRLSWGLKVTTPALTVLIALAGGGRWWDWLEALGFVALVVGSAGVHEIGHVLAARNCGMRVEAVTLTLFGGSTAYSGMPPTRSGAASIAAAGPLASAFLAVAMLGGWMAVSGHPDRGALEWFFSAGVVMNGAITVFNLIPLPGFDGARILGALLSRRR